MTLSVIDAFVEHDDARVVVQCDCGERLEIFDTLDAERAIDQATELHPCPRCLSCDEPIIGSLHFHAECFESQSIEVSREQLRAYFEAMPAAELHAYTERIAS